MRKKTCHDYGIQRFKSVNFYKVVRDTDVRARIELNLCFGFQLDIEKKTIDIKSNFDK